MIVERWHTRFHSPRPLPSPLLEDWHAVLEDVDDGALVQGLVGAEEWLLIRRLPLQVRWRVDGGEVAHAWFSALRQALEKALGDPGHPNVVRYPSRRHAWADLLYRAALGDCGRAWAWVQMDLLPRGLERDPAAATVLAEAVTRLGREAELIWPVLRRLLGAEAERAAFTALLRALPEEAWRQLMAHVPQVAPYLEQPLPQAAAPSSLAQAWPQQGAADAEGVAELLRWTARQPWLAMRHAAVLAPLLAGLTWPALAGPGDVARGRLLRAHAFFLAAPARQGGAVIAAVRPAAPAPALDSAPERPPSQPPRAVAAALPAAPALPEVTEWLRTECAGALFWLSRVEASGVIAWLETLADAPPDALLLFLGAVADGLGVARNDPVRRVFTGDCVALEAPANLLQRAGDLLVAWEAWLEEIAPDLPQPRLASVCRRPGRLLIEPGWIELVLPLDSVDTRIRRLGLDLDPGWLPWLGCVVRIRYE